MVVLANGWETVGEEISLIRNVSEQIGEQQTVGPF